VQALSGEGLFLALAVGRSLWRDDHRCSTSSGYPQQMRSWTLPSASSRMIVSLIGGRHLGKGASAGRLQGEGNASAAFGTIFSPDLAALCFDQALRDGQA
jgi:hypothetical protein